MTERRTIIFGGLVAAVAMSAFVVLSNIIVGHLRTWYYKPAPTHHHCDQCEIAYSRGLFHGIDYAERGVARLEDQDGHRFIVWCATPGNITK